jgi:hypothetical protein
MISAAVASIYHDRACLGTHHEPGARPASERLPLERSMDRALATQVPSSPHCPLVLERFCVTSRYCHLQNMDSALHRIATLAKQFDTSVRHELLPEANQPYRECARTGRAVNLNLLTFSSATVCETVRRCSASAGPFEPLWYPLAPVHAAGVQHHHTSQCVSYSAFSLLLHCRELQRLLDNNNHEHRQRMKDFMKDPLFTPCVPPCNPQHLSVPPAACKESASCEGTRALARLLQLLSRQRGTSAQAAVTRCIVDMRRLASAQLAPVPAARYQCPFHHAVPVITIPALAHHFVAHPPRALQEVRH